MVSEQYKTNRHGRSGYGHKYVVVVCEDVAKYMCANVAPFVAVRIEPDVVSIGDSWKLRNKRRKTIATQMELFHKFYIVHRMERMRIDLSNR